jgi:hypothetical protein
MAVTYLEVDTLPRLIPRTTHDYFSAFTEATDLIRALSFIV